MLEKSNKMKEQKAQNQLEEDVRTITDENLHTFHPLVQEAYRFTQANKDKILFPRKYYASQKDWIRLEVKALRKNHPDMPVKDVMIKILEPLPGIIPADKLAELLKFAAGEWDKLQKHTSELAS